jgi:Flp pilus assembly pilin Flp
MKCLFWGFAKDEKGATAIEYGFVALLISVTVVISSNVIGVWLKSTVSNISNNF